MVVVAGFGSEVAWASNSEYSKYAISLFFLALVGYITPWVGIFLTFGRAVTSSGNPETYCEDEKFPPVGYRHNRPPDFVWIAVIGLFVTFTSFAVAHFCKIWNGNKNDFLHNLKYEIIYSFLSFTSKILLLANIGVGVVERSNRNIKPYYGGGNSTLVSEEEETNTSTLTWFMLAAGGLSLVLGIGLLWVFNDIIHIFINII